MPLARNISPYRAAPKVKPFNPDEFIGKKHALKKFDQFALNTGCFWASTGSNITPVVQFDEIFVTIIMKK